MVDGLSLDVPLDRDRLRALTQPLVDRSIAVCQRLLKQQRGRERAFHVVYETLSSYGVWLFNRRRQRVLGNRVFRFLMIEACLVRDDAACRLQAHNTCIGC